MAVADVPARAMALLVPSGARSEVVVQMYLPYREFVVVSDAKVLDYLLAPWHRQGGPKAAYFMSMGFTRAEFLTLSNALLEHGRSNNVVEQRDTQFGTSFVVEGLLATPRGIFPVVRTVWFLSLGTTVPHLVTAFPARKQPPSIRLSSP